MNDALLWNELSATIAQNDYKRLMISHACRFLIIDIDHDHAFHLDYYNSNSVVTHVRNINGLISYKTNHNGDTNNEIIKSVLKGIDHAFSNFK
jgi:hypothetical protein